MRYFFTVILTTMSLLTLGQNGCGYTEFRQFDFWIGEWSVSDTNGKRIGKNEIVALEDECVLQEHWQSKKGTTGTSINFFNKTEGMWNQIWVDNSGNSLKLHGGFFGGKMVMRSEVIPFAEGDYMHEISWTPQDDGSIHQVWNTLTPGGEYKKTLFYGVYERR